MSRYRAWYPSQAEPEGFSLECSSPYEAASALVRQDEDIDAEDLQHRPQLVLVRGRRTGELTRVLVTSEKEVRIWGYPA